ncbi:L-threonylcarbamoyladenylate synthase [Sphingomonas sp.]|jgi:L-threonylcarbamoyladenylate synthase|uniref:L-threonylcarbamoyladenylate synthase n=1 Tax=Sphingomonas sp. TaxID=28214 RepID=UPI002E37DD14|nr:L-threonylcarbamoyladenylate synthase [Sphingomonas sp.]HEX4694306.1 L-threonylcarbamoyladenylate synthase [Sphingomonas sp.]
MEPPNTRILPFNAHNIAEAAALIAAGQCVAVPTETVYGLAADATDGAAVARIYATKGRPSFNPLIVHVLDMAAAKKLAAFDARAETLAKAFWPGPLTLVLPVKPSSGIASLVTAGLDTIAIRVPQHRAMRALLEACGKPLAAPSANASGTISPTRVEHVVASLGGRVPLVIDDGPTRQGIESTIVREVFGMTRILRHGPIAGADILAALSAGKARVDRFDTGGEDAATIEAPGQLSSHYAPRKPLRIDAPRAAADEWMIGFGATPGDATLSATGDLTEAATRLFDLLHKADASTKPRIAVAPVPDDGIGEAINDRLRRAAAPAAR